MNEHLQSNREVWDAWARLHVGSRFYDVEGFKAGRDTLDQVELDGVGEVRGKTLLHLQCHFGLGTLSWARRGARVTGVDFSEEAVRAARALAEELGLPAVFVRSAIHDLPRNLAGEFDVVFTSHGVLPWLPDLEGWARVIARFLKPGGTFYVVDSHPLVNTLDDRRTDRELRIAYPYFERVEPLRFEQQGSYAVPEAPFHSVTYEWPHSLSEVIESLLRAGLRIESFREYPYLAWAFFPWMEQREDGMWHLPDGVEQIPLMFSLRATR